ncbi:hypothetical protein FA13DRAFT_1780624 [Coprinellus micaceus]|uniref:CHAT domain-containing protein n=1 Tax=Coprinellus micaceus TaxID=71717 RepID=A0A4Y7SCT3_COPMI|nr:hypothetical protein FA13DRAFT_1780624 [Coprinellus micaceus]
MVEQQSTPSTSDGTYEVESPLGSKGVTAKRIEDRDGTKVSELRIFGLDGEHWKSLDLYRDPSGELKVCGPPMVLPPGVVGIRCAYTMEGVEGLHIIRHSLPGCGGDTPDAGPGKGGKMLDAELHVLASWQSMHIPIPEHSASIRTQLDRWETLYDRFKQAGDLNDISEAISTLREVVEKTPEWDENLAGRLNNLGTSFLCRFGHTGNLGDLAEAMSLQTRTVDLTPEGHDDLPTMLMNLGNSYLRQFERTGNLGDVAESISLKTRAVALTPEGHADLPTMLMNLGNSYLCQFERIGDLGDVAESISLQTRAVGLTPEGHADLPSRLTNLGNSYLCQFERIGNLGDVAESISWHTRAVGLTPEGHADLPSRLNNLGNSYLRQFERTGNLGDVAESISWHTRAVGLTPEGHADLPGMLMNLGSSYLRQFERTGNLGDVAESISLKTRAVALTPEGHADLPTMLMNLGNSYLCQFERTGNLGDVAESISLQTRAVGLTPERHAALPGRLMNLGTSYMCRFDRTDNLLDISEAVSVQSRAVHLTPAGHADRPSHLSNLGICFSSRFELTHDASDLSQAISAHTESVDLTPSPNPHLPMRLNNLATSLLYRFQHSGDLGDVTDVIALRTRIVGLAPEGHALLPRWLAGLGNAYTQRFARTSNSNDITEAIYNLRQAVRLTPEMHASLPSIRNRLAYAWYQYYLSSGDRGHLCAGISNSKSAALCSSGRPEDRLQGARWWATCLIINTEKLLAVESLTAFETAMNLLALVAGLEETVQHRYARIEEYGGLPVEAAAIAITLDALQSALEWLEQGRCLVWGQQSRLRTPLDELRAHNEPLANRVMEVSRLLEGLGSSRQHSSTDKSMAGKVTLEDKALEHTRLASEWDHLLEHVRGIPGFETFLRPLRCAAILQHLPRSGPVIVLNVHDYRCDAIVLRAGSDELQHIPLPHFTLDKAKRYRRMLGVQLQCHGLRDQGLGEKTEPGTGRAGRLYRNKIRDDLTVNAILESLWEEVVKPILSVLGLSKGDKDMIHLFPRIWWCPTGPLSFLPLHAAGVYRGEGAEGIADYAVSSYTPTVTALTQRVKNDIPIDERVSGLFLTCQPEAPYAGSIHGTKAEVRDIHKEAIALGVRSLSLKGDAVPPEKCLEHMEEYSSIHLACHGFQDTSDPLRSRFLFHKGRLHLGTIMQKNLPNADLAYLSACQTSTGQETLADEVVHLAAGMLAAGYRRVVSTMWEIDDGHASQVARDFYQYLWKHRPEGSGSRFDGSLSAYALHYATQELRGRLDNADASLLAWMPFVHYGY